MHGSVRARRLEEVAYCLDFHSESVHSKATVATKLINLERLMPKITSDKAQLCRVPLEASLCCYEQGAPLRSP